jgi:hypothetical protein
VYTDGNLPTTKREASAEIMMRVSEQFLKLVSVFIEASRNFAIIVLLLARQLNIKNQMRM